MLIQNSLSLLGIKKKESLKSSKVDDVDMVKSWKGFLCYEMTFVAIMFLELFWNRLDTLIASFYFTEAEIATQSSWMNSVMTMDCFAYGFGLAAASKISKFMIQENSRMAIKVCIIANLTIFCMGCVFGVLLHIKSEEVAALFIDDPVTQLKLTKVQRMYSWLIPFEVLQGGIYATVRSIGKQSWMLGFQILANYFVHFGV